MSLNSRVTFTIWSGYIFLSGLNSILLSSLLYINNSIESSDALQPTLQECSEWCLSQSENPINLLTSK